MSNIKLFTENIADFTLTTTTTEAIGYEKEFMLDRRLATYWKGDGGGSDEYIHIDLESASRAIDHVFIYAQCQNGAAGYLYHATQSNYGDEAQEGGSVSFDADKWNWVKFEFTAATYRYWRIKIDPGSTPTPNCSTIQIGSFQEISLNYDFGGILGQYDYSGIKIIDAYGGQRSATRQAEAKRIWQFKWDTLDNTNKGKLETALTNINGAQYPFVYKDPDANYYYVRWMTKGLNAAEFTHQLYRVPTILLEEELGTEVFQSIRGNVASELGYDDAAGVNKNIEGITRLIEIAYEQGHKIPTLEKIVEMVTQLHCGLK